MEKKVKCVSTSKNPNGTGTAVFHQFGEGGRVTAVIQVNTEKAEEVELFIHQGEGDISFSNTLAKHSTPVE